MPIECEICGLDRSKSGKPFTRSSLAKHMTMVHGGETVPSPNGGALACDLCGATESGRGRKFLTWTNVLQHKKKVHLESIHPDGEGVAGQGQAQPAPVGRIRRKSPAVSTATRKPHVKFCPHCGFNLEVVHAAMEFVNGDSHL